MVSRITGIETDDGEVTIADLIRFFLSAPEFKVLLEIEDDQKRQDAVLNSLSGALNSVSTSLAAHTHSTDEIDGINKYIQESQFKAALTAALGELEDKLNIAGLSKQIDEIRNLPVPEFDTSTLEQRLERLEKRKPEIRTVKGDSTTIIQEVDKDRLVKIEQRQSEIVGILDNMLDNSNEKIDSLRKEIMLEVVKKIQKEGQHVNIVGGVGGVNKLKLLFDVNVSGITNGQGIAWNATTEKWEPVTLGGGGGTWGTITGTLSDQTDLQAALDAKVTGPASATDNAIARYDGTTGKLIQNSGATIDDSGNITANNLSGTNTGDQTSIVGITGTKIEFDTACTDGNFLYVGDVTQYTDEMAQDAVGGILVDSSEIDFTYNDVTPSITASLIAGSIDETKLDASVNASLDLADSALQGNQTITLSGDITGSGTTGITTTLATVNGNVGTFGSTTQVGQFTVNAKGLITAASNQTIASPSDIVVANEATDTTCFPLFATAATGTLGPKTNANLIYNSSTSAFGITGQLNIDNIRLDGNTISATSGTDIILTPQSGGEVVIGTNAASIDRDLLVQKIGVGGTGIGANSYIIGNISASTGRGVLDFQFTLTGSGGAVVNINSVATYTGSNVNPTIGSVTARARIGADPATGSTMTGVDSRIGFADAANTISGGTHAWTVFHAKPTNEGVGGTHTGGTVRIYGLQIDAIGTLTGVTSQTNWGIFSNEDIAIATGKKILLEGSTTTKGDTYLICNSATTDVDMFVDNVKVTTWDNDEFTVNDDQSDIDFRVEGDSISHLLFCDATSTTENIAVFAASAPNWQTMDRGFFVGNSTTAPTGNPTGGGFLYAEAGALKWRGSGGTITTIAAA